MNVTLDTKKLLGLNVLDEKTSALDFDSNAVSLQKGEDNSALQSGFDTADVMEGLSKIGESQIF